MLATSPELHTCYTLKEDFRPLFNQLLDRKEVEKIRGMSNQGGGFILQYFEAVCGPLLNWWQQILNYFVGRVNNGFA